MIDCAYRRKPKAAFARAANSWLPLRGVGLLAGFACAVLFGGCASASGTSGVGSGASHAAPGSSDTSAHHQRVDGPRAVEREDSVATAPVEPSDEASEEGKPSTNEPDQEGFVGPGRDTFVGLHSRWLGETQHHVDITLDRGHATLVVRREIYNPTDLREQGMWEIYTPPSAVATGLRTLGRVDGKPVWYQGDLLESGLAKSRYEKLEGAVRVPKEPALLSWGGRDQLRLSVFPVLPERSFTVEYTLQLPTRYRGGAHEFELPTLGQPALPPVVTVSPRWPRDAAVIDGQRVGPGFTFVSKVGAKVVVGVIPDGHAPSRAATLDGGYASKFIERGKSLTHVWLGAAPQLSPLPQKAHVVVLLDESRSVGQSAAKAARTAAVAYVDALPEDASVEVLSFDRVVRPHHGQFVSSRVALDALKQHEPELRNGSQLDEALEAAKKLLVGAGAGVDKRVVVFSDTLMRGTLSDEQLALRFRSTGALVHGAEVDVIAAGAPGLYRRSGSPWAAMLEATGGVFWHVRSAQELPTEEAERAAYGQTFLELVRPTRIHQLTVGGEPVSESVFGDQTGGELLEGAGLSYLALGEPLEPVVVVRGKLWGRQVEKQLRVDRDENRLWSALVFGTSLTDELSDEQQFELAQFGGAVTSSTSYLTVEPGERPRVPGKGTTSLHGGGGSGLGRTHQSRSPRVRSAAPPVSKLADVLVTAWINCGGRTGTATLTLETTRTEVVDVIGVSATGTAKISQQLRSCIVESAWALELDKSFQLSQRHTYVVPL